MFQTNQLCVQIITERILVLIPVYANLNYWSYKLNMYINSWLKPDRPSEVSVYRGADCFLLLMITSLCDARELRRPRPSLPLRKKTELLNIRAQHSSNRITYQIKSHLLSHLSLSWENIHHKYDYINVSTHAKKMQVAATHFF